MLRFVFTFVFFTSAAFANEPTWVDPERYEAQLNTLTKHYAKQTEIVPLLAGEQEFITLYRDHTAVQAKGIVILIADWQLSSSNPQGIDILRRQLNQYGWVTYSLTSGEALLLNQTTPEEKPDLFTAPTLPSVEQEAFDNYKLNLVSRFKSTYQQALNHPGFIVLVAQGQSGAVLMSYLKQEQSETLDTVILLNGFFPDQTLNQALAHDIAKVKAPLLDISYQQSNRWNSHQLSQRKALARKAHKFNYRQRTLFGIHGDKLQNERLFKEVYGFITKIGM